MKKFVLLLLVAVLISFGANATIHVVQVANFQFTPDVVPDVIVGDTMRWVWVSGSHTTTNDPETQSGNSLPAGAPSWNAPMNSSSTTFDYRVLVAGVYQYWCIPHSPFMAASFTASNLLPIKLSAFAVSASNGAALLNWKTSSEQNTDYFSVRRSLDGMTYNEIAKIPAAGNSNSEKLYSFADRTVSANQYYYYNLAIVDKDGRREFSDTKIFKGDGKTNKIILTLSPNPISTPGHLMMTFNADKEGTMEVELMNSQGQAITKTQMQAYVGVNSGHMHLGVLPAGNYVLICVLNGVKETHQVVYKQFSLSHIF